ncbi:hypothetical protein B0H63DRAFT_478477 [Podospora didyma]|uniref:Uncharacterized protein n=1 Tax=Podospora didyma TaxID=330526 RepID=A0AAE0KK73_9PEZI|nr:hypothetical protein B0H63DRAFT_478477 [Podospora didyma]
MNRLVDDVVILDDLTISFRRTIRVPDNEHVSELPPDLGPFPLFRVKDFVKSLPSEMVAKGGLLFPMYDRESMWISFSSEKYYAIKVYSGAVNVISGEPSVETAATKLHRRHKVARKESIQDYIVTPSQRWIDGIATAAGQVRQFVATPLGSGYSLEAQATGQEVAGGLQFEITPLTARATVQLEERKAQEARAKMEREMAMEIARRKQLEEMYRREMEQESMERSKGEERRERIRASSPPPRRSTRLRGEPQPQPAEMNLAPGGLIRQSIVADDTDPLGPDQWDKDNTIVFNVQILNTSHFARITGKPAPATPITAQMYASLGGAFFSLDEEKSNIAGDFDGLKSVGQLDGLKELSINPTVYSIGKPSSSSSSGKKSGSKSHHHSKHGSSGSSKTKKPPPPAKEPEPSLPVVHVPARKKLGAEFFNQGGPKIPFRSVKQLEAELGAARLVSFD